MEQSPSLTDTTQIAIAKKILELENHIKGGVSWFFWIAGLSVLNSIIFFSGGTVTFVVGLGITQFIDAFISVLAKEINSGASNIIRIIGFGLDFLFAGIFAVCGVFGRKKIQWVIIVGLILYALDGLITLAFGDWLGVFFHVFALVGIGRSLKAIKDLAVLEKSQVDGNIASLQKLITTQSPPDTATYQRNIVRFALIIIIPFALLFGLMLILLFMNS